ncbi:hypothetical protein [Bacillus licheniformis]|uniref:hypothetical protein n=1 Tax=Bacillus licheniformis TaxID=1402 RepID=UPI000928077B|nr:hypothetical protein [Bacillus licheniformis]OJT57364.1 hypothetical protein BFP47_11690 [Bacillus licheniformis]OJT69994.1 hypothetical protein BFP46_05200 [Bacillus licheniformis]
MSKKIPGIREASDIVFKRHAKGIGVFMITKNNGRGCIDEAFNSSLKMKLNLNCEADKKSQFSMRTMISSQ